MGTTRYRKTIYVTDADAGQISCMYRLRRGQEDKASRSPARHEQGDEIFQVKLEVLDLVATDLRSGESALAFQDCENTLLDFVLDC